MPFVMVKWKILMTERLISCNHPDYVNKKIKIDFSELWDGAHDAAIRKNSERWLGAFLGRPNLAKEIFPILKVLFSNSRPSKIRSVRTDLRQFFRFLDSYESWVEKESISEKLTFKIDSVSHITVIHGLRWLNAPKVGYWSNAKITAYRNVIKILSYTRRHLGLTDIWMPSVSRPDQVNRSDVPSETQGKEIVAVLASHAKSIWDRWNRADYLASVGKNLLDIPRNPLNNRKSVPVWDFEVTEADIHATYRAFISETGNPMVSLKSLLSRLGYNSKSLPIAWWPRYSIEHPDANKLIGFLDVQFGLYPSAEDINTLFLLFMARSGWNPSTTLRIDVSDESNWTSKYSDKLIWLYSYKARGNSLQDTMSWGKQSTGCYQIIKRLTERTAALRSLAEREPHRCNHPNIVTRSPWLAASQNTTVPSVYVLEESSSGRYDVLDKLVNNYNARITEQSKKIIKFKPTDFRDIFASAIFRETGYSLVMTQIALGHKKPNSTYKYLRSRAWRHESELKKNALLTAVFDQIEVHKKIDYTLLRAQMDGISISDEDLSRLEEYRKNITYSGVGCSAPNSPPAYIDPSNPQDGKTVCAQGHRCPVCPKAKVFNDSLPLLTRRLAELNWLKANTASIKWEISSDKDDQFVFEATLKQWPASEVEKNLKYWSEKIDSGEHRVIRFGGVH